MAMNKDFGGFELKEKIGSGGMASVYLAVQKSLARPVVLKILYPHLAEDEKLVQRFEREARAAAMMRHENIIQVIDCGRYEDVAYIAMEFVEGMDLKKWLEAHGSPPIEMAMLMMRDLCRGLEHAHAHRIVHRDIKPANVMLTPDGTIKIMDFGLARSGTENSTQMTMVGSVLGTPAYMSPEQATGEVVDERSDIFSAGVLAYELLGGQRPFSGDSYSTVLRSILTVEPPELTQFNPLVPEEVARIVRGMLAKDVGKRTQTIGMVREALEDFIEQSGLHRGKDLLREYAMDPQGVAERWRQKKMSRHMDQGLYFENMGLGKIDDALLEFRRVLHLDPKNTMASDHVKKLEREREKLISRPGGAAAAASSSKSDETMVMTPEQASAAAAAPSPGPIGDDGTVILPPGAGGSMPPRPAAAPPPPPPPAKPAAKSEPKPAPKPAAKPAPPKPAAPPAAKKGGLPMPALIGVGLLLVAVIALAVMQPWKSSAPVEGGADTTSTQLEIPSPPVVTTPSTTPTTTTTSADTTRRAPLYTADSLFNAGKYPEAIKAIKAALADRKLPSKDQRAARELLARTYVRSNKPTEATAAFVDLLKSFRTYKPGPGMTAEERSAFETAKLNLASAGDTARALVVIVPPPPPTTGTATVVVSVSPFAESFLIDGTVEDQNKKQFRATVKAGRHVITVKHPSLGSKEWTAEFAAGETKTFSQDFAAASGSISVNAEPTWGEIYMDGVRIGHTTPWEITPVPPGKHEISLVREGWTVDGGAQTADVRVGETKTLKFKLKRRK